MVPAAMVTGNETLFAALTRIEKMGWSGPMNVAYVIHFFFGRQPIGRGSILKTPAVLVWKERPETSS